MSDILSLPRGRGYSEEDVRRVVADNEKQRFALKEESGRLWVRANQGHSMEVCVGSKVTGFRASVNSFTHSR